MGESDTRQHRLFSSAGSEFGQHLRTERLTEGYSLADLARKVSVTKGYLSRLECGKAKPSAAMIERIAKALSTDLDPLYVLAGYLPTDVKQILYCYPVEAPAVLREAFGEYSADGGAAEQST